VVTFRDEVVDEVVVGNKGDGSDLVASTNGFWFGSGVPKPESDEENPDSDDEEQEPEEDDEGSLRMTLTTSALIGLLGFCDSWLWRGCAIDCVTTDC